MSSNREIISKVRKSIQEKDADSTYTNKYIYSKLSEHLKWLIAREIKSGGIFRDLTLFQTRRCMPVIKVPKYDACCPIDTGCSIYRTRYALDGLWADEMGPIILRVTSLDGSTDFSVVSAKSYQVKKENPYKKYVREQFAVFDEDGFLWWEEKAPKKINIQGFFKEDITGKYTCDKSEVKCIPFLDKKFIIPGKLEAELVDKVVNQILGRTKQAPADESIDKSENRPM